MTLLLGCCPCCFIGGILPNDIDESELYKSVAEPMVTAWSKEGNIRDCLVMLHGPTGSGKCIRQLLLHLPLFVHYCPLSFVGKTHTLCPQPKSKVAVEQKRGLLWNMVKSICPTEDTKMVPLFLGMAHVEI
jgi:hypothetical protein